MRASSSKLEIDIILDKNEVINLIEAKDECDAARKFQIIHPELRLNNNGYSKQGEITHCIAAQAFN